MIRNARVDTHKQEDTGADVHHLLHRRLVERIVNWIRVLVIAMITDPGLPTMVGS